jgi:hypothetical protein
MLGLPIEVGWEDVKSPTLTRWRGHLPTRWHMLIEEAWSIGQHFHKPSLYRSRLKRLEGCY